MNQYNSQGKRHGYWEVPFIMYADKRKLSGYFVNGHAKGYWIEYLKDGKIINEMFIL